MVSVIVPVYNGEKYLAQCVESILRQTFADMEILLIDDGSTDSSGRICDAYAAEDTRVRALHISNSGVGAARNRGLNEAMGEWVLFVDADDVIDPGFVETFFLHGMPADDCLVMQGYRRVNRNTGKVMRVVKHEPALKKGVAEVGEYMSRSRILEYGAICSKLYNRGIIEKNGLRFDTGLCLYEDQLFYLGYLNHIGSMRLMSECGYIYMDDGEGNSLTSQTKGYSFGMLDHAYRSLVAEWERIAERFGVSGPGAKELNNFLCRIYIRSLLAPYKGGRKRKRERLSTLRLMDRGLIRRDYRPESTRGKALKYTLLFAPLYIKDIAIRCFI